MGITPENFHSLPYAERMQWIERKRGYILDIDADTRKLFAERASLVKQLEKYTELHIDQVEKDVAAQAQQYVKLEMRCDFTLSGHRCDQNQGHLAANKPHTMYIGEDTVTVKAHSAVQLQGNWMATHSEMDWETISVRKVGMWWPFSNEQVRDMRAWALPGYTLHPEPKPEPARCKAILDPTRGFITASGKLAICDLDKGHENHHHTEGCGWWADAGVIGYAL